MSMRNYGRVYGQPKIAKQYGGNIGNVKKNIKRKISLRMKKPSFGFKLKRGV